MTATDTVSVLPNVVTDGTATITEDYAVTYAEEHDGDTITVWAWATLTTGSATYGGRHVGMASGDITDYRRIRTMARDDAQAAARAHRSACRDVSRVLSTTPDVAESFPAGEVHSAGWVDATGYRLLRALVTRHVYGNARTAQGRSAKAHVRAGITAQGMPLDVDVIDDATQYAAMIARRWADGHLPEHLAEHIADCDAESATRAVLGAAARDGLRRVTHQHAPTELARKQSTYAASLATHSNGDSNRPTRNDNAQHAPVRVDRTAYVAASSDSVRTDALLARLTARDARGNLTRPHLLALFLADGNVDDAGRSLNLPTKPNGQVRTSSRDALVRACRAEWDLLADGSTADDAREWLDGLTYAR